MTLEEIVINRFLDKEEAEYLRSLLKFKGVKSYIQQVPDDALATLYNITIHERDLKKAKPVVLKFQNELKSKRAKIQITCPVCKSTLPRVHIKTNLSWWRKIFSIGTTVMECDNCKTVWYV